MVKKYLCGKRIKQNESLVELLKECGEDFEIVPTFKTAPMRCSDELEKECYRDHIPMTICEHQVGIPLIPKDSSRFGKPLHPKISNYVSYFIAPIGKKKDYGEWALYEVMWRKNDKEKI